MSVTFYGKSEELNVSNTSARMILQMLDLAHDCNDLCGELPPEDVLTRLSTVDPAKYVSPTRDWTADPSTPGVVRGPTVVICGYSLERVQHLLDGMRKVAEDAKAHGIEISFA